METIMSYAQELKDKLKKARTRLVNIENEINKRFDLAITEQKEYISDEEKNYLMRVGHSDLTLEKKLQILINVEYRYNEKNSNQLNLF